MLATSAADLAEAAPQPQRPFLYPPGRPSPAPAEPVTAALRLVPRDSGQSRPDRATRDFLKIRLTGHDHEIVAVLVLDNRHGVIEFVPHFRGTIDGTSVYPREVVKEALRCNAAAVIRAHNHPSGVTEPSQADELIITRLRDALGLTDVRVLDHSVVMGDAIVSFVVRGLL